MVPPVVPIPDTLKGVDDLIRAELEAYRGSCFDWLLAATGLVVIGLFLEGPELWHEIKSIWSHWRFERRFHFSLPETEIPEWVKLWAFAGWFLIVAGVAGEFVADSFVSKADGFVQKFDEILLAEATKSAGNAATSARIAHEEADSVTGIANEARADAKDALAKAQSAQRELAHAEADAANAQTAASKALDTADKAESHLAEASNKANALSAKYERLTTPRSVPVSAQVAAPLKLFSGMEYVFVGACEDMECLELVWNINELLKSAGWKRVKGLP